MKVGNEMEIFITLAKYNTCQWCEEGKPLSVVYYLISILIPHLTIVSNVFMRNGTYSLMFIGRVYNKGRLILNFVATIFHLTFIRKSQQSEFQLN